MAGISAISNLAGNTHRLSNLKKSLSIGAIGSAVGVATDLITIPGAFSLDYNKEGEKVEGTNFKSGFKELGKSLIRASGYIIVPAVITSLSLGSGPILGAIAGLGALASQFALASVFEKILPTEQKLVAEACKEKGIEVKLNKLDQIFA